MTGFVEARYEESPKQGQRKVRMLWQAIKQATGSPPSLIHYRPPQRRYDGVFHTRSSWVIHHEKGTFTFTGKRPQEITEVIRAEGLTIQEETA